MSEAGSSRRSSVSIRSAGQPTSLIGASENTARSPFQTTNKMSGGARQASVSIFTGRGGSLASPGQPSKLEDAKSILSPGSIDRVFPVRSAVSIDHTATPMARGESGDSFPGMNLGIAGGIATRREKNRNQARTTSRSPPEQDEQLSGTRHVSGRRKYSRTASEPQVELESEIVPPLGSRRGSDSISTGFTKVDNQTLSRFLSDNASLRSDNNSSLSGGVSITGSREPSLHRDSIEPNLFTARFKHLVTDGGHAVITGRDGETLQRCEDEPIHIPGAIQSFGLLLAFREEAGKLIVRVVSENSYKIIGYTPAQLFSLDNLLDIFTEDQADNLLDHLDFIRDDEAADVMTNGPEVFMLSVRPPQNRTRKLWCAMHIADSNPETIICEFEMEDDPLNPLVPAGEATPEPPEDTLGSNPTDEELAESTVNISKPLRVLRSARKKRGEAAAMEVFNIMSQVQEQLASAPTLQVFLRVLIGVVKELTGFHRVMIYQFDQTWNGRVVAELVDTRATKDLYKGLNFPASDIPRQARELYKINKVRLLYDRDQETARLVCRTMEDLEKPLDMTHAYLRAMSPIHIKYLSNMAVRSSMSISINAFNELWGLIACHSYGAKGMRVSFPIRKMCRLVGDTACRNIERLSYASRLQARKLINTTSTTANPSGYIVASSEDLLTLFDADVGALSIRGETKLMGNAQSHLQEILAMIEYLRMRKLSNVTTSQDIATDFPDLRYAPGLKYLAGVMYVPLSGGGNDFIAFFRKGALQEVKWAGNPYEKFIKEGTEGYLEPRKSFKTWSETIVGRCREWTVEEIETASVLCLVYGKFIDVWRQKEAALQNSQLTRLLLANSAHEVRTPLNAIINYLEIALEGSLDQDTRENLSKSHSASKSLVYVINDLLDLTKTEGGKNLVKEEMFNLSATVEEATDPFIGDAKRKGIDYHVIIAPDLPTQVIGDHRRVRQVLSNLVANAIQHTLSGTVTVQANLLVNLEKLDRCEIEIVVEDTGAGMSQSRVDALFRELEEVSYQSEDFDSNLIPSESLTTRTEPDRVALGLGLAVVARTIRTMNGQLRLKTEEGKGSRFVIQLGFAIDSSGSLANDHDEQTPSLIDQIPHNPITPGPVEGEVLLIDRSSNQRPTSAMLRKASSESVESAKSLKSMKSLQSNHSQKSDADRLIDAIQEPFHMSEDLRITGKGSLDSPTNRRRSNTRPESPTRVMKAKSIGSTVELKSSFHNLPGQQRVTDSGIPLIPVRVPEPGLGKSPARSRPVGKVLFDEPESIDKPSERQKSETQDDSKNFSVLVAEDDPINSRIMKKRLENLGHRVYMTVNGEECASAHGENPSSFDVVLMDLQMPIVDGFSSVKMIRSSEKTKWSESLSPRARLCGRIPVFAVSASLVELDKNKYIDAGFDGWILKPVDFKRVDLFFKGVVDDQARNDCVYQLGKWEQGGWFRPREEQEDVFDVSTRPNLDKSPAETGHDAEDFEARGPIYDPEMVSTDPPKVVRAETT